ncbi:unnamed protein product [Cuscuta epithymum]|uniref:Uncharacterized protein n=1 Tax=Cuscuta epithymum TaxID=186058 RepID=A0AAV0FY50_9ASTE|nr:unnamed protein product [Cuscuta epithymum]
MSSYTLSPVFVHLSSSSSPSNPSI